MPTILQPGNEKTVKQCQTPNPRNSNTLYLSNENQKRVQLPCHTFSTWGLQSVLCSLLWTNCLSHCVSRWLCSINYFHNQHQTENPDFLILGWVWKTLNQTIHYMCGPVATEKDPRVRRTDERVEMSGEGSKFYFNLRNTLLRRFFLVPCCAVSMPPQRSVPQRRKA